MKIAALIVGILLMVGSGIAFVVSLALPSITNNRVNFEESLIGLIPSIFFLFAGFVMTVVSAIFVLKGRKAGGVEPTQ